MRIKTDLDEYMKKDDVEKIYNYQKKVFDSKIEDIEKCINKIEDCFSLRFGENLSDNKYAKDIENIKIELENLRNSVKDKEKLDIELNKISYKVQVELEKSLGEEKEKFKKFNEEKAKELETILENSKFAEERVKKETEEYIEELKQRLEDIAKDGRSRTAIGKQEKTIKTLQLNKKEIDDRIQNLENEINLKLQKLNYEETIQNLNNSILKLEKNI